MHPRTLEDKNAENAQITDTTEKMLEVRERQRRIEERQRLLRADLLRVRMELLSGPSHHQ